MAQSVIPKKEEKLKVLFEKYGMDISIERFKEVFIAEYPKDWVRVNAKYEQEMKSNPNKKRKKGMPHPNSYIKLIYNNFIKKHS